MGSMTGRRGTKLVPSDYRHHLADYLGFGAVDRRVIRVLGKKPGAAVFSMKGFDGGLILKKGHYDLTIPGLLLAVDHHPGP